MPAFDGNLMPPPIQGLNAINGDLAAAAWSMPFPLDRPTPGEPGQMSFSDAFKEVADAGAAISPEKFPEIFKDASNVEFSTAEQNKRNGKQADYFLNAKGQLVKNPGSQAKPGDALNIELQPDPSGIFGDQQKGILQSILDTFRKGHPLMSAFPRTWEEVLQMLQEALTGDSTGTNVGSDSSGGSGGGGGGGSSGGDYGGGTSGGGGGAESSRGAGGSRRGGGDGGGRRGGSDTRNVQAVAWDGKSHGDMSLADLAKNAVGRRLWEETQYAGVCEGGNVGCAASVTKMLHEAGYTGASSAGVIDLRNQLVSPENGWTESGGAETAQPGDVIYSDGGGQRQHIGIVGVNEKGEKVIYNNSSSSGQWTEDPFNACSIISDYDPSQVHVLHAPDRSQTQAA